MLLTFIHTGCSGGGHFLTQPSANQTAEYGQIKEFKWTICGCTDSLRLLVNDMQAAPVDRLQNLRLDSREYGTNISCTENQYVAKFWMFVNDRTLHAVDNITCKIGSDVLSEPVLITDLHILYPEVMTSVVIPKVKDCNLTVTECNCFECSDCFNKNSEHITLPHSLVCIVLVSISRIVS